MTHIKRCNIDLHPLLGCRQEFDRQSFYDDTLMERLVVRAKEAEETNARSEQVKISKQALILKPKTNILSPTL